MPIHAIPSDGDCYDAAHDVSVRSYMHRRKKAWKEYNRERKTGGIIILASTSFTQGERLAIWTALGRPEGDGLVYSYAITLVTEKGELSCCSTAISSEYLISIHESPTKCCATSANRCVLFYFIVE